MDRIPEDQELMDAAAQAQAYAAADFAEPHGLYVEHFLRRVPPPLRGGRAIDLGCGPADITVRLARACPTLSLLGVDGAPAMLDLARARIAREGLDARIQLQRLVLPGDGLQARGFDIVVSNSLLHHLTEPAVLWQAIRHCAKPGAAVLVMDLRRPQTAAQAEALVAQYADGEPEVLRRDFHRSLLAAFREDEVRAQLEAAGLPSLVVERISDRHLLVSGTL